MFSSLWALSRTGIRAFKKDVRHYTLAHIISNLRIAARKPSITFVEQDDSKWAICIVPPKSQVCSVNRKLHCSILPREAHDVSANLIRCVRVIAACLPLLRLVNCTRVTFDSTPLLQQHLFTVYFSSQATKNIFAHHLLRMSLERLHNRHCPCLSIIIFFN